MRDSMCHYETKGTEEKVYAKPGRPVQYCVPFEMASVPQEANREELRRLADGSPPVSTMAMPHFINGWGRF